MALVLLPMLEGLDLIESWHYISDAVLNQISNVLLQGVEKFVWDVRRSFAGRQTCPLSPLLLRPYLEQEAGSD